MIHTEPNVNVTMGGLKKKLITYYIYEPGANLHSAQICPFRVVETHGPLRRFPQHNLSPLKKKPWWQRGNIHLQRS